MRSNADRLTDGGRRREPVRAGLGEVGGGTAILHCKAILAVGPVVFVGERPASGAGRGDAASKYSPRNERPREIPEPVADRAQPPIRV